MALEALKREFISAGVNPPKGLIHILLHHGTTRHEVYRALWSSLMFVEQLKTNGARTLVYPLLVRQTVRERFNDDPEAGAYDEQYVDQGYHVTMEEVIKAKWREPPKKCKICAE